MRTVRLTIDPPGGTAPRGSTGTPLHPGDGRGRSAGAPLALPVRGECGPRSRRNASRQDGLEAGTASRFRIQLYSSSHSRRTFSHQPHPDMVLANRRVGVESWAFVLHNNVHHVIYITYLDKYRIAIRVLKSIHQPLLKDLERGQGDRYGRLAANFPSDGHVRAPHRR